MSLTCESWVPVVRPHLANTLVSPSTWETLRFIARQFARHCQAALEIRLGEGSTPVDFSACVAARDEALILARRFKRPQLTTLLQRWGENCRDLEPVSAIWLEFDLGPSPGTSGEPLVCVRLRPGIDPTWLVDVLLPALHAGPLAAEQRRLASRAAASMPPGGRVLYAFSLDPRPGRALRLELYGLDPRAAVAYLRRLDSGPAHRQIAEIIPLASGCDRYHLSFDLGADGMASRIGLECGFARLPHREPRWRQLFDRLVDQGLATAAKCNAVFRWPGYDTLHTATARWPQNAIGLGGYCIRCLSHAKIVTWPDRQPEAKAYLLYQYLEKQTEDGPSRPGR